MKNDYIVTFINGHHFTTAIFQKQPHFSDILIADLLYI